MSECFNKQILNYQIDKRIEYLNTNYYITPVFSTHPFRLVYKIICKCTHSCRVTITVNRLTRKILFSFQKQKALLVISISQKDITAENLELSLTDILSSLHYINIMGESTFKVIEEPNVNNVLSKLSNITIKNIIFDCLLDIYYFLNHSLNFNYL